MTFSANSQSASPHPPAVLVVGGGLAGIAASVRLAQAGVAITLVETRKRLGGRATSFVDPTTGAVLDNSQHVLLKCCTNLLDLYARLGVADQIAWHRRLYFADSSGCIDMLVADDLPAPLHLAGALLGFTGLTWGEKIAIARGMLAILRLGRAGRARCNAVSFAQWLADHGQPKGAVAKFWAPVTVGAINELPDRMAAEYALQVFQDGLLSHQEAYVMGLATVPLVRLYDAAERIIQSAGGTVLLGASAMRWTYDPRTHTILGLEIAAGRRLEAPRYISALPFDRLAKLCPQEMVDHDARLQHLHEFTVSPIIGIHLFFETTEEAPVMSLPHLSLAQSPLHWVFNKGWTRLDACGLRSDGAAGCAPFASSTPKPQASILVQHLHGVVSAAYDLVDQPAERIIALAVAEIRRVLPQARQAELVHAQVVKEKRATFAARPGIGVIRPGAAPGANGVTNLFLAGDWCATGWPATMEGSVRSGYLAAGAALGWRPEESLAADLPASGFYRFCSGDHTP